MKNHTKSIINLLVLSVIMSTFNLQCMVVSSADAEQSVGVYCEIEAEQEPFEYVPIEQGEEEINSNINIDFSETDKCTVDTPQDNEIMTFSMDSTNELWGSLFKQQFGEQYTSPYEINNDKAQISGGTNRLSIEETDLHLDGKNGLDLNLTIRYDNQYYNYVFNTYKFGTDTVDSTRSSDIFERSIASGYGTGISSGYNIERIIHPNGLESRYRYKLMYQTNVDAAVGYGVYAVDDVYNIMDENTVNHSEYSFTALYGNIISTANNISKNSKTIRQYNENNMMTNEVTSSTGTKSGNYNFTAIGYNSNDKITRYETGDNITSQTVNYSYISGYENCIGSETHGNKKILYTYHSVNGKNVGIPQITTYQYKLGNSFVTDYFIETTLTEDNKSVEYKRTINDGTIKSQTKYEYDSNGEVIKQYVWTGDTDGNGVLDTDDDVLIYNITNPTTANNNRSIVEAVENVLNADNQNEGTVSAQYDFDIFGKPIKKTDSLGNITTIEYDSLSRPIKYTLANGGIRTVTYDPNREYVITIDESGIKTKYQYNKLGQIIRKYSYEDMDENIVGQYIYDTAGRLIESNTYNNLIFGESIHKKELYIYDILDRPISKQVYDCTYSGDALMFTENYTYASQTKTTSIIATDETATATVKETYDNNGNIIKTETTADGKTLTITNIYDYLDRPVSSTDAKGNITAYEYDVFGNTVKVTDALLAFETAQYDMAGRQISQTDKNGNTITYTYDKLDRNIKTETPFGTETAVTKRYYDKNSNIVNVKVKNSAPDSEIETYSETTNQYDNMNNLIGTLTNDGEKNSAVRYQYDVGNRVTAMITGLTSLTGAIPDTAATTTYEYDELGHVQAVTNPLGYEEEYFNYYDGTPRYLRDKNNNLIMKRYGIFGIKKCYNNSEENIEYTYNRIGQLTKQAKYEGIEVRDETNYTYDGFGRITSETNSGITNSYTYDNNSNVVSHTVTENGTEKYTEAYTYDNLNRLTGKTSNGVISAYVYDNNGNMTLKQVGNITANMVYNNANLPVSMTNSNGNTQVNSFTYAYNLDGNKTLESDSTTGITKTYTYDNVGRVKVESISENNLDKQFTYGYDVFGNRKTATSANETKRYEYDKANRLTYLSQNENNSSVKNTYFYYDKN